MSNVSLIDGHIDEPKKFVDGVKNAPCNNCADRCYKCHSVCEKYILYKEIIKKEGERRKKVCEQNKAFYEQRNNAIYKESKSKIWRSPKR